MLKTSENKIIIFISIFLVVFANFSFFSNVLKIYPFSLFFISIIIVLTTFLIFLFSLVSSKYTTKPLIIAILIISSITAYFMDSYNVIIDESMIKNVFETNLTESIELFNFKLIFYIVFLGFLPSYFIFKAEIKYSTLINRLKILFITLIIIILNIFAFSKNYTSFFREHKPLRYYANPPFYIYSFVKYLSANFEIKNQKLRQIGLDAKIPKSDLNRELIILVVGEAARFDRFSINGYEKETNPNLKQEDIISFQNFHSCGTTTAVSVPCMFSIFGRENYEDNKAKNSENLLDVLKRAGVYVLWRDNNSDSKSVATRVNYENFKTQNLNKICDIECRDEGMLDGLQEIINSKKDGDILIILHQMGNHGPAYYKRYPKEFEKFTPVCKSNQLEECSEEEINNAYDNAISYTDYFLSKTINLLKQNSNKFETALFYISDHGESLGESGLYLHGMPYFLAPDTQTHIPAIAWFGDSFHIDKNDLKKKVNESFSQDNLFHTMLNLFEINSSIYDKSKDIINYAK